MATPNSPLPALTTSGPNEDNIGAALDGIADDLPIILLSHNPSVINQNDSLQADLIVSGHTHGGQIRLPGIGPLGGVPTDIDQKYDQGTFAINNHTTLAITRGLGESSPRARLFAWPEILLLETK